MEVLKNAHSKWLVNTAGQLTETKYFENSYKAKATQSQSPTNPLGELNINSTIQQFEFSKAETAVSSICRGTLAHKICKLSEKKTVRIAETWSKDKLQQLTN